MKKEIVLLLVIMLIGVTMSSAQEKSRKIPLVDVKNLKGETINTSTFSNDGKPMIISFWATWCKPCVLELSTIDEQYAEWQKETGVKLIAISIDDSRNTSKVAPFVAGKGWDYEVYMDPNGDLKRAMNVNNVPHSFLLNGKGEIVWQHNAFAPGDEDHMYELIKDVIAGKEIKE